MHFTLRGFVALSVALHVGAGLLVAAQHVPDPPAALPADRWAGPGVEIDSVTTPDPAPALPNVPAPEATPERPSDVPILVPAAQTPRAQPRAESEAMRSTTTVPRTSDSSPNTPVARARTSPAKTAASAKVNASRAAAAASESAPAATETPRAEAGGQPFGASALPAGVRHLPNAFTRALAIANRGDPRWQKLAFGRVGEAHVRLSVNEQGELGELEYEDERERDELAPVVRHLLGNTMLLLRAGRFSLDPKKLTAGLQRLRVVVEVSERAGVNSEGDPGELFGVAWEAPQRDKPGKSGFILNSGRQVTAWVWIE